MLLWYIHSLFLVLWQHFAILEENRVMKDLLELNFDMTPALYLLNLNVNSLFKKMQYIDLLRYI